jgi:hypothetical protein
VAVLDRIQSAFDLGEASIEILKGLVEAGTRCSRNRGRWPAGLRSSRELGRSLPEGLSRPLASVLPFAFPFPHLGLRFVPVSFGLIPRLEFAALREFPRLPCLRFAACFLGTALLHLGFGPR